VTKERYELLMNDQAMLTPEEIKEGWHFCHEWDDLLVGPGMEEVHVCTCHVDWEETK
jgi:hypothetical protein